MLLIKEQLIQENLEMLQKLLATNDKNSLNKTLLFSSLLALIPLVNLLNKTKLEYKCYERKILLLYVTS